MTRIAEEHIERWPSARPFRLLSRMRVIADEIFARLVLGMSCERANALASAIYRMLWTPGNPPLPPPGRHAGLLGALGTRLFDRRKQPVGRILAAEIDARRTNAGGADGASIDVIGAMLRATPDKPTAAMWTSFCPSSWPARSRPPPRSPGSSTGSLATRSSGSIS
jgi:hypothetical protein